MVLVVLSALLIVTGYDLLPLEFGGLPLFIPDDVDYLRSLAWYARDDDGTVIQRTNPDISDGTEKERSQYADGLHLHYHTSNKNIFTKENLRAMKHVEQRYTDNEKYRKKFCFLNYKDPRNVSCSKMTSILRYFDGTYGHIDESFNDINFDNIVGVLHLADTHRLTSRSFQYHKHIDAVINSTTAYSTITRSRLVMGWPLRGFVNTTDRKNAQIELIEQFEVDEYKKMSENYYSNGVGEMGFFFGSNYLLTATIMSQVFIDMCLAIGSLVFIVGFVIFQTGSCWVSLFAVLSIMTSFLGANLIYRIVLDYRYLGIFHVLTVFIILGIGADDVFVFFDTWKESRQYKYKSLAHRMSDVYRKASLAMLFTSVTTAMAFIVSATSPFVVISSFGVFAGILVVVNYLSVVIFFPTVVITYHLYWEKYKCCCCCQTSMELNSSEDLKAGKPKSNFLVRFISGPYYNFVTHKIYRWVVIVCFAALVVVSLVFAVQLEINEEEVGTSACI